jgi:hypothetical protein
LPNVCAKTGEPTTGRFRIEQPLGQFGLLWLLVFLGPVGWIVLLVLALTLGREVLTVRLPYTEAAVDRELNLIRFRILAFVASVGLAGAGLLGISPFARAVWFGAAAAAFVVAVALSAAVSWVKVDVRLDASRRWVTLRGVHPAFAEAVRAQSAQERLDTVS